MDGKEFSNLFIDSFFVNQKLDKNKRFLIINNVAVYPPAEMFLYCINRFFLIRIIPAFFFKSQAHYSHCILTYFIQVF